MSTEFENPKFETEKMFPIRSENAQIFQAPTKPSNSILTTFLNLHSFKEEFRGSILSEDECQEFLVISIEEIGKK